MDFGLKGFFYHWQFFQPLALARGVGFGDPAAKGGVFGVSVVEEFHDEFECLEGEKVTVGFQAGRKTHLSDAHFSLKHRFAFGAGLARGLGLFFTAERGGEGDAHAAAWAAKSHRGALVLGGRGGLAKLFVARPPLSISLSAPAEVEGVMRFSLRPQDEFITLQSLLKAAGLCDSGGAAKVAILAGEVKLDGEVELRRGKKVRAGQKVAFAGEEITVTGP